MKCAIYCRVSTEEQDPEKQKEDCLKFAESRGYEIEGVYLERVSGFKDVERLQYELVKQKAFAGEIQAVVVWAFDRWVRNRDTLIEDVSILRQYGCKLHSVKDAWLEAINIEGSIGKTIREFLLGLRGSMDEMESQRKSERTRMAYQSHKGGRWGRKSLPTRVIDDVKRLHDEGLSIRKIADTVTYYDKHRNVKNISIGAVHKIIAQK